MEPDHPGWYRDPKSPGGRRYWDGQAWVDIDQVVGGNSEPRPVAEAFRLVSQRRSSEEVAAADLAAEEAEDSVSPGEAEPLPD
jgi:hypothetical protein